MEDMGLWVAREESRGPHALARVCLSTGMLDSFLRISPGTFI